MADNARMSGGGTIGGDGSRPQWTLGHCTLLRTLRQERGWSQRRLANAAGHGVTQQDVSDWETDAAGPSGPKFAATCEALGWLPVAFQTRAERVSVAIETDGAQRMDAPPVQPGAREALGETAPYATVGPRARHARVAGSAATDPPSTEDRLLAMLTEALAIARTQAETSKAQAAAAEQSAAAAREAAALARQVAQAMAEVLGQLSGKRASREGLPQ